MKYRQAEVMIINSDHDLGGNEILQNFLDCGFPNIRIQRVSQSYRRLRSIAA